MLIKLYANKTKLTEFLGEIIPLIVCSSTPVIFESDIHHDYSHNNYDTEILIDENDYIIYHKSNLITIQKKKKVI